LLPVLVSGIVGASVVVAGRHPVCFVDWPSASVPGGVNVSLSMLYSETRLAALSRRWA